MRQPPGGQRYPRRPAERARYAQKRLSRDVEAGNQRLRKSFLQAGDYGAAAAAQIGGSARLGAHDVCRPVEQVDPEHLGIELLSQKRIGGKDPPEARNALLRPDVVVVNLLRIALLDDVLVVSQRLFSARRSV